MEVVRRYFNNTKPACGGVDHRHADQTIIITNNSAAQLLLSYIIAIWTYYIYMHRIPRF